MSVETSAESGTHKDLNTSEFIFIFSSILWFRLHSFFQPSPCICSRCFSLGLSYLFLSWRHQPRRSSVLFAFPFSCEALFCLFIHVLSLVLMYPYHFNFYYFFSSDKFWIFSSFFFCLFGSLCTSSETFHQCWSYITSNFTIFQKSTQFNQLQNERCYIKRNSDIV